MAFSINTNNSAMTALESLRSTAGDLAKAEKAVSTGLSVSTASDNPAIYAISQQMNGNISGLAAVSSSLSFGAQVVSTASSATSNILTTLQTLQNTVTQAGQTGISTSTEQAQVANALNQINTFARNSTFNGINLLTTSVDAGATVTSGALSVVDGLQGSTLNVTNQTTATSSTAVSLTDALGLTNGMAGGETVIASGTAGTGQVTQSILTDGASGLNISLSSTLASSSFADASTVVLSNGDGSTTTFEFDDNTSQLTSSTTATNNTIKVTVDSTGETSNAMIGDLVNAMNANGYNAIVQTNGSVNVTGKGVGSEATPGNAASAYGFSGSMETAGTIGPFVAPTVVGGVTTADGSVLSGGTAVITTLQSAINKMTSIASTLGDSTTQITGMQTFTSDLSDALTSGVGALTDADLSAESAKLTSLQTKQSLAIQALSIANSQSSSLLSLFR